MRIKEKTKEENENKEKTKEENENKEKDNKDTISKNSFFKEKFNNEEVTCANFLSEEYFEQLKNKSKTIYACHYIFSDHYMNCLSFEKLKIGDLFCFFNKVKLNEYIISRVKYIHYCSTFKKLLSCNKIENILLENDSEEYKRLSKHEKIGKIGKYIVFVMHFEIVDIKRKL